MQYISMDWTETTSNKIKKVLYKDNTNIGTPDIRYIKIPYVKSRDGNKYSNIRKISKILKF